MSSLPQSDIRYLISLRGVVRPSTFEMCYCLFWVGLGISVCLFVAYAVHKRPVLDRGTMALGSATFIFGVVVTLLFFRRLGLRFFLDEGMLTCRSWGNRVIWQEDITKVTAMHLTNHRSGPELILDWDNRSRRTFIWNAFWDLINEHHFVRA
jgi:hypothetical protein